MFLDKIVFFPPRYVGDIRDNVLHRRDQFFPVSHEFHQWKDDCRRLFCCFPIGSQSPATEPLPGKEKRVPKPKPKPAPPSPAYESPAQFSAPSGLKSTFSNPCRLISFIRDTGIFMSPVVIIRIFPTRKGVPPVLFSAFSIREGSVPFPFQVKGTCLHDDIGLKRRSGQPESEHSLVRAGERSYLHLFS